MRLDGVANKLVFRNVIFFVKFEKLRLYNSFSNNAHTSEMVKMVLILQKG